MPVTNPTANNEVDYLKGTKTITDVINVYEAQGDTTRASIYKTMRQQLKAMKETIQVLTDIVENM